MATKMEQISSTGVVGVVKTIPPQVLWENYMMGGGKLCEILRERYCGMDDT